MLYKSALRFLSPTRDNHGDLRHEEVQETLLQGKFMHIPEESLDILCGTRKAHVFISRKKKLGFGEKPSAQGHMTSE